MKRRFFKSLPNFSNNENLWHLNPSLLPYHLLQICFGSSKLNVLSLASVTKKTGASFTPDSQSMYDFTKEDQTASIFHSASRLSCRSWTLDSSGREYQVSLYPSSHSTTAWGSTPGTVAENIGVTFALVPEGWERIRWLHGITDSMDMSLREGQGSLECSSPWGHKDSDMT